MGEASLKIVGGTEERKLALGKSVGKAHLVNRLNYINFQDQTIMVNLRHVLYDSSIFLRARPLPCAGERLDCLWAETESLTELLKTYRFGYLLIPDGKKYLVVNSEVATIDEKGLGLILPVTCREFEARRIKRHPGAGITVQIIQNAAIYEGEMVDFTPVSLRVEGSATAPATSQWFNPEAELNLRLLKKGKVLFSGPFRIISQGSIEKKSLVLSQVHNTIQRFKSKRYRTQRQQLVPSPNIVFDHPLIEKRINLKMADLSGTGFAVEESEGESVLMAGMIISGLRITFAQGFSVNCTVQVVSRNLSGDPANRTVRCGMVILDMDVRDHVRLLSILHQVTNQKSYVGTEVDLNDLWDFFFDTGFIYPGKYAHFQANKEEIKRTYAKLYGDNPHIARHFIYQDRGAILGHMAMVRFYQNSWMIHHHAARKSVTIKAGLAVLDMVSNYLNELENFAFAHLRFVYCYYRPDNKFPSRVFGGFARRIGNLNACSEDRFAYSYYRETGSGRTFPERWELASSSHFDLVELGSFYRYVSGGLLLEAFDLLPERAWDDELEKEYRALTFKKEKYYYSLRKDGSLKALLLVNRTDAGFNMADLTNCVTLMVLDDTLPREMIDLALEQVCRHYDGHEMPVLSFPLSYLEKQSIPYDKCYVLWIVNLQYSDDYFAYCEGLFRTVKKAPEPSDRR